MHTDTLQELVKEGLIKGIGLSEVSSEDVRKAHAVHPITAVEMEWSLFARTCEVHIWSMLPHWALRARA